MKPWTDEEQNEIAQMRKAGHPDSYISGQMKVSRMSNVIPPVSQRSKPMATKKKAGSKKKAKKKVTKKKVSEKAGSKKKIVRKPKGTAGRKKGGFQVGEKLTAVKGLDDSFYQKFPRYKAYQLICSKGSMATSAFVDAVEKLDGVKSRGQALGILTKLLDKECVKASGAVKKAA